MIIGLVANPVSSKDIRRLTGLARVVDIEEKANLTARLLVGIGPDSGAEVLAFDDSSGLVRRAVKLAGRAGPTVDFLRIEPNDDESDTRRAAALLAEHSAEALVTVGGDGTVRSAVEGWADVRLVPLAAGTNNAFNLTDEPTVIGVALMTALSQGDFGAFVPTTALAVDTTSGRSTAVVDVVSVGGPWLGSGAIWDPAILRQAVVTSARPTAVGIASVSATFGPLAAGFARWIRFGGESTVRAVFGPGLVLDVPVAAHEDGGIGSTYRIADGSVLALDGERRLPSLGSVITVVEGPSVLDPTLALTRSGPSPLPDRRPDG